MDDNGKITNTKKERERDISRYRIISYDDGSKGCAKCDLFDVHCDYCGLEDNEIYVQKGGFIRKSPLTEKESYDIFYNTANKELKQDNGNKFDKDKLRLDLISIPAINGIAEVLTYGSRKYGDRNWEKGLTWSRVFGALLRHLFAFWQGKDLDDESDLDHIDHAMCCLMFLSHYKKTKTGNDDRK